MCVGIKGPGICVGSQFTRHGQVFLCMVDDKRTCPVPYPLGFHFVCAWWLRFTSLFLPSFLSSGSDEIITGSLTPLIISSLHLK